MAHPRRRPVPFLRRIAAPWAAIVIAAAALTPATAAKAGLERLPDLRMLPPDHFTVCGAPPSGTPFQSEPCPAEEPGDAWLRFDSIILNAGEGPFRVKGSRPSTAQPHLTTKQWIRGPKPAWRKVPTDAVIAWGYEQDGHPHWHTQGIERYRLFALPAPFPDGVRRGVKRGFCFFDGLRLRPELEYARPSPVFTFSDCGQYGLSEDDLTLTVGLSVGWGDIYPWNFAGQRIDISDVPDGRYLLCLTADPTAEFEEMRDGNNESWARIRLTTRQDPYRVQVEVLASGQAPCQNKVPYEINVLAIP